MEAGSLHYPTKGTPQGGVISPLLANIYLHEVLDKWIDDLVKLRLQSRAQWIRFADDAVSSYVGITKTVCTVSLEVAFRENTFDSFHF